MKQKKKLLVLGSLLLSLLLWSCDVSGMEGFLTTPGPSFDLDSIPEYAGEPYVVINENAPDFSEEDLVTESYETYGALDYLGRCTQAAACIGTDLMPTEKRGNISHIKPSGWQISKYNFIDGSYLYNRCHLIAFQLAGENDNERNLITGTRYMNATGMLEWEELVGNYVRETGNHVLYRVTPIFQEDNLIASGVQMEAMSVEDKGSDIMFNIYVYNVQPLVHIDYATGDNYPDTEDGAEDSDISGIYVLNTNTGKFHNPDCSGIKDIHKDNKSGYEGNRENLIKSGYKPCGMCNP